MNNLLEALYSGADGEEALINSGTLSQSSDQFASLWAFREGIAEAAGKSGKVYKYDISVPVSEFVNTTNRVRERVGHKVKEVVGYGHVGDGMARLIAFGGGPSFYLTWYRPCSDGFPPRAP